MKTLINRLTQRFGKPFSFGIYGAIGCLLAAIILGEGWLVLTHRPPSNVPTSHAIVLLIDSSSSMQNGKLDEVQSAALRFVQRQATSQNQLAVVSFGESVRVAAPLTSNTSVLQQAIEVLSADGGTPMAEAIQTASQVLQNTTQSRDILLFTDGLPDNSFFTLSAATVARNQGILIVAVGTGDADTKYLAQVTGDPLSVFYASSGNFDQAFRAAEKAIYDRQLVESEASGNYGLGYSALRIGGWAGCLALGLALALAIGQNQYLKRRLLTFKEGSSSTMFGLIAGLAAGAIGQLLFAPMASIPVLETIGRVVGWVVLGSLMGMGMSLFVPNLKWRRAVIGGSLGGLLGALGFLWAATSFTDVAGRLIGAAILGFFIGLMIALIEQLSRKAWLVVHWGTSEQTKISLGTEPIILGCSDQAHIYLPRTQGYLPTTAKIFTEANRIVLQFDQEYGKQRNMKNLRQELENGSKRKLGNVEIEVKTFTNNIPKKM